MRSLVLALSVSMSLVACNPGTPEQPGADAGAATPDAGSPGTFTLKLSGCPRLQDDLSGARVMEGSVVLHDDPNPAAPWCENLTDRSLQATSGASSAQMTVKVEGNKLTLTSNVTGGDEPKVAAAGFEELVFHGEAAGLKKLKVSVECEGNVTATELTPAGLGVAEGSRTICGLDKILGTWDPAKSGSAEMDATDGKADVTLTVSTSAVKASVNSVLVFTAEPIF